jgi:ribosomal protein L40E
MEIFDNIAKKLTDAADFTIKEAEKLTGAAKAKFDILNKQNAIDDILIKIGTYVYDEYTDGALNNSEPIKAACVELKELYDQLNVLKEDLASKKNYKICEGCGAKIDRDMQYCHKCGKQQ